MVYTNCKTSGDAIQPKHQPLTPTTIEIMPTFTHTYLFTPHTHTPTHLNQWEVTYEDEIDVENRKLLLSLTHK